MSNALLVSNKMHLTVNEIGNDARASHAIGLKSWNKLHWNCKRNVTCAYWVSFHCKIIFLAHRYGHFNITWLFIFEANRELRWFQHCPIAPYIIRCRYLPLCLFVFRAVNEETIRIQLNALMYPLVGCWWHTIGISCEIFSSSYKCSSTPTKKKRIKVTILLLFIVYSIYSHIFT